MFVPESETEETTTIKQNEEKPSESYIIKP